MATLTIVPCGHGPRGDAAFKVLDDEGEIVRPAVGLGILTYAEAAALVNEKGEEDS